jgi:hypothetical protein
MTLDGNWFRKQQADLQRLCRETGDSIVYTERLDQHNELEPLVHDGTVVSLLAYNDDEARELALERVQARHPELLGIDTLWNIYSVTEDEE